MVVHLLAMCKGGCARELCAVVSEPNSAQCCINLQVFVCAVRQACSIHHMAVNSLAKRIATRHTTHHYKFVQIECAYTVECACKCCGSARLARWFLHCLTLRSLQSKRYINSRKHGFTSHQVQLRTLAGWAMCASAPAQTNAHNNPCCFKQSESDP